MSSLREQKLLGDCMWGVIPLDLRNVPGNVPWNVPRNKMHSVTSPLSITASASTSSSSSEIKRLTHERMFLQERYRTLHYTMLCSFLQSSHSKYLFYLFEKSFCTFFFFSFYFSNLKFCPTTFL